MNIKQSISNIIVLGAIALTCTSVGTAQVRTAPKNVILFIADGSGPTSFTMTREYKRLILDEGPLTIDPFLVGTVRTYSSDNRIADSASSATAYACGVKTYKDAVAVDELQQPVATIVEAAETKGMWTGIISTSGITDATPASFSAHVTHRNQQSEIARQQVRKGIELLLGGGRTHFEPISDGGTRNDRSNQINAATRIGYQYVSSRSELLGSVQLPLLGLFANDHMALEIDRDETGEPSLTEMTATAIRLLSEAENGFLLIVETEGTDDGGHDNDAAAVIRELLSFDAAVATALAFAQQNGETLVLATSDHDAGGLSLGIGGYSWQPEVIQPIESSIYHFYTKLIERVERGDTFTSVVRFVREQMVVSFGIEDLTDEQWLRIEAVIANSISRERRAGMLVPVRQLLIEEISSRAGVGWSTRGHTGVDVNMYASGPGSEYFMGNMDNSTTGQKLAEVIGLDLEAETTRLRR